MRIARMSALQKRIYGIHSIRIGGVSVKVKVRKVGNSYTVTVPAAAVEELRLSDGQELEVVVSKQKLEYRPVRSAPFEIDWSKYQTLDADIRDGMSPEEYVRSLRDYDRDDLF